MFRAAPGVKSKLTAIKTIFRALVLPLHWKSNNKNRGRMKKMKVKLENTILVLW